MFSYEHASIFQSAKKQLKIIFFKAFSSNNFQFPKAFQLHFGQFFLISQTFFALKFKLKMS